MAVHQFGAGEFVLFLGHGGQVPHPVADGLDGDGADTQVPGRRRTVASPTRAARAAARSSVPPTPRGWKPEDWEEYAENFVGQTSYDELLGIPDLDLSDDPCAIASSSSGSTTTYSPSPRSNPLTMSP